MKGEQSHQPSPSIVPFPLISIAGGGCRQLTVTLKCEAAPFWVDTSGPSIGRRGSERGGRRGGYSTERNGLETDLTGMRIARFHVWLVIQDPDIFKSQYFKTHITPEQYLTRASFFLEMKDDPVPIYHLCWLYSVNCISLRYLELFMA